MGGCCRCGRDRRGAVVRVRLRRVGDDLVRRHHRGGLMAKSDEYGQDNPRPWDPNHWSLTVKGAPHETAAVLRMQRAGHPASKIMQVAKIKGISLVQRLQSAM